MVTNVKASQLNTNLQQGNVVSDGKSLRIEQEPDDIGKKLDGHFDPVTGVLTIEVPDYPILKIRGILTVRDIEQGKQGETGYTGTDGIDGIDGRDGDQGNSGCIGPEGKRGRQGSRGMKGQKGETGDRGDQGEEGNQGKSGTLNVYLQEKDPGPIGAGGIWIKP